MIWVAWRQARGAALGLAGILAAYGVLAGVERWRAPSLDGLTAGLSPYLLVFIALLLGAPLLAREYEQGTHELAWTQSVTRRRWLALRLGMHVGLAVSASVVMQTLLNAVVGVRPATIPVPGTDYFLGHGFVPYALAVFTVVAAATLGAVLRRLLPTVGGAIAVVLAVTGLLDVVRFGDTGWAARFWPAQLVMSAALLALAGGLAAVCFRLAEGRS
ncbi:hypothetical protein [Nonomuraea jiangxiensis]|uniref:ABC-2 family transporter protein n=1 Tax=Nonomuraea jiangxiensis TaxID=633440 RepID=A0A1G7ZXY5_9ACTN|nr:hypothetical protein [Nonomuraea jiangxiensis]SDH13522.1 hypothetical protein SAMN05421869_101560 [Nonomuraea jiangxiensis]